MQSRPNQFLTRTSRRRGTVSVSTCSAPPIQFGNVAPISRVVGDGTGDRGRAPGGDHRAPYRSYITLGDEGLYVRIFRYRSQEAQQCTTLTGCLLAPEIPNRLDLTTCQGTPMKSVVVKRSVVISGRKTGVSLEDEMSAKCHK